ncbi:FeS assembly SUF system protein [Porphyromonas macacae]|uniref:FeS assembly SUF system protein n=1 Tax=Porphyromonas macacae TaxID=28115 RepID=A0A0A2E090_9PORP|nr:iron-sulfur cluster assembly protein [Porphyromonas macacae]KGN72276.1 FeS assembly SUF system protein [Porphyromonas macacae]SUB77264.1 FeS assembly SUF system protein [Porphyromonas macacae]SUB88355.1 FeS assembly SUF system protein [Porphyromonas macacae]
MENEFLQLEEDIVTMLKTVYDPEIPVNIFDLGLIYKVEVGENGEANITMTLTAPNCPAADFIVEDVKIKVESVRGIKKCHVDITFEPEWNQDMMSEEAKLELGFL